VSCGTNGLIRDGAVPITSTDDILLLAGFSSAARGREGKLRARSILETAVEGSPLERQLWDRLRREPASLDRLVAESAESPRALLRALTVLEVAGLVRAEAATYVAT
jgi:predicted Rossmann fold nucleotide-binding protein DprA/Smf involved in DNA uptake